MSQDSALTLLLIEDNPGDARYIREALRDAAELSRWTHNRGGETAPKQDSNRGEPNLIYETRLAGGAPRLIGAVEILWY